MNTPWRHLIALATRAPSAMKSCATLRAPKDSAWQGQAPFVRAGRPDVALQDYGDVEVGGGFVDLDLLSYAPLDGWSRTGRAELIAGHAYAVRIGAAPYNYAKFAVTAMDSELRTVTIDWAYQLVPGSRELTAVGPPRPPRGDGPQLINF